MSKTIIKSFRKQLKQVKHQPIQEDAQEQDEQQVRPKGDEHVNAPNMDVAQKGKVNEQHQNVAKLVMQSDPRAFSTTRQKTP